ncbi:hypothetical protein GGR57DRAFT_517089 [Xylariaceae sp. FL1272]|nr:hypothetical protein GGR57DRAFT_517089 [Xylariaceae sp. FL1272]
MASASGGSAVNTKLLGELDEGLRWHLFNHQALRLSMAQFRALGQAGQQQLRQRSSTFPSGVTEWFLDATNDDAVFLAVPHELEDVYGRHITNTNPQGLRSLSDRVRTDARSPALHGGRPEERVPRDFAPYAYIRPADTAYTCFRRAYDREDIVQKVPGKHHMAVVADMWKNLAQDELDEFVVEADRSKAERARLLQYKDILCVMNVMSI